MQHKKTIATASLLSSLLFVSAQEVAQTTAVQGDIDPNGSTTCVTIDNNLRYKMKDSSADGDVSSLQDFLIANRYMQGTPTGYFGLGTLNAVKQFQKRSGLSPTGYVGVLTRAKIKDTSCNDNTAARPFPDQAGGSQSLQKGEVDRKQDVIQKMGDMMEKMKGAVASSSAMMTKVNSLMSDEDKALLKQKEDDLKTKRDAVKALLDSYGGSTKDLTEDQKTALKAKMEEVSTAEKSLMESRKVVMDKIVGSLSESDKALIEKMKQSTPQNMMQGQKPGQMQREGAKGEGVPFNGSSTMLRILEMTR